MTTPTALVAALAVAALIWGAWQRAAGAAEAARAYSDGYAHGYDSGRRARRDAEAAAADERAAEQARVAIARRRRRDAGIIATANSAHLDALRAHRSAARARPT